MRILGIETSCDETAAAVVEDGIKLLSNVVASSIERFEEFGGVVPEIAARAQIEFIQPIINKALKDAKCGWKDIDAIGVTYGPGLGGSLLVGVMAARTLAIVHKKPLYGVNHVTAHIYANFLTESSPLLANSYQLLASKPEFPILALIVSGGHSQLVLFNDHFEYELLGQTHDDAIGEAFDKIAKMLGLPYPGGPSIEKTAPKGDALRFRFPKAKLINKFDYSFSGLKTAVLHAAQKEVGKSFDFPSHLLPKTLNSNQKEDIAASFQKIAVETVVDKTVLAYQAYQPKSVVIAGGVAANKELRTQLEKRVGLEIEYPDIKLCTDNGAMIASAAYFMHQKKLKPADPFTLEIEPGLSM